MKENFSLALIGWIGILLIVIGFEGSLGRVLACIFTPSLIVTEGSFD